MVDEQPWIGRSDEDLEMHQLVPLSRAVRELMTAIGREERLSLMYALQDEFDNEPISDEVKAKLEQCEAEEAANPHPGYTIEQIRDAIREGRDL